MVGKTGFEPATPWSQTKCSTKLSHFPILVRSRGFGPPTFWSVVRCSIQLSYERIFLSVYLQKNGGFSWNRTNDTKIFSLVLCQLSYEATWRFVRFVRDLNPWSLAWQASVITTTPTNHGCGRWIWTNDLWVMSPTSYQTALSRDINKMAEEKGFEPLRRFLDLPVFKTGPFNQTWVFLHTNYYWCPRPESNRHGLLHPQDFKSCASTYSATEAHLI